VSERRGFTLVELLLALAILATLLAVAYGGVIQFMQSRSDLEAAINAQAKLRRIVEVFTQDLRSAVFGGLSATPYPSGNASVSFALIEGGAGYPVLPHDSGDNQSFKRATEVKIVVLAEALSDVGIAPGDEVLMVNNLGDGAIPYTAALELKKVKDEASRKVLLEEARAGLSLRELRARVREVLRKEKAPRPWYREVGERLLRLDLEALPPERRALVERKLKELEELLG